MLVTNDGGVSNARNSSTNIAWQDRLDACPQVVAFFGSVPGLAFLHRLVLAFHVVLVEIGACGIRLVCLRLQMTGLHRFVGASYGTQQRITRRVEEAIVAYRREETERLARAMAPQDITGIGTGGRPVTQRKNWAVFARSAARAARS